MNSRLVKVPSKQKGMALITTILLLVVGLLLALSSYNSSRFEESMAGNQRAAAQARMAAEYGVSQFANWLDSLPEDWPVSTPDDDWKNYSTLDDVGVSVPVLGASYFVIPENPDWVSNENQVSIRVDGFVSPDGEASEAISNVMIDVVFNKPRNGWGIESPFTCYDDATVPAGETRCNVETKGQAEVTGENYLLPEEFDCQGNAANKDGSCNASLNPDDTNYPDVADTCYPNVDGSCTTMSRDDWYDLVSSIYYEGGDGVYNDEVVLFDGQDISQDLGGRDDAVYIAIKGDVSISGNINTSGIILVEDGATISFSGTGHHEGIVIVKPGGKMEFSSGTPYIYGGVVELQGRDPEDDLKIDGDELSLYGTAGVRFSGTGIMNLKSQLGLGIKSWEELVSGG